MPIVGRLIGSEGTLPDPTTNQLTPVQHASLLCRHSEENLRKMGTINRHCRLCIPIEKNAHVYLVSSFCFCPLRSSLL